MEENGWRQPIRYLIVAFIFVAVIWFIIAASQLFSSLIIAALLAYTLHPIVNLFVKYARLSRRMAVNLTYLLFLSVLVAIPALLTPFVFRQASDITPDMDIILQRIRTLTSEPLEIGGIAIPFDNVMASFEETITQTTTFIASNAVSTLGGISTNLLWILVILVSIYYLLKDGTNLTNWVLKFVPIPYQEHGRKLINEIDTVWSNFLRGQLLLMLIVGILSWLGGVAVGLPGAFAIGIAAGVLDLIPSLGPTLAAIIAVIVAFVEGSTYLPISNFLFGLVAGGVFLVVQQVENIWIRPALMGHRLRLHPALIFIGVFSSLALFGILSALVVIPVMSSIGVLGRYIHCRIRGIDPYPNGAIVSDRRQISPAQTSSSPDGSQTTVRPVEEHTTLPEQTKD